MHGDAGERGVGRIGRTIGEIDAPGSRFDPATGNLSSTVTCGIAHAIGKTVATTGTTTYVAGDGASPGVFGRVMTTGGADAGDFGLFVARLK